MSTVDQALSILQESGYRVTAPRRSVVEAVHATTGAFTADELLSSLAGLGQPVGRATVFRTLDVLVRSGLLDRLHRPDGCHNYVRVESDGAHRHHLICSDCGAVVEFDECTVAPMLEALGARTDFEISGHWLEVFGVCSDCRH